MWSGLWTRRRSATSNCARCANCSIPRRSRRAALVETALWVARYYFAPPGEVLRALFPAGTQVAGERRVSLTPKTATLLSGGFRPPGLRPQEDAILDILAQEKSLTLKELAERSGIRGAQTWIDSLAAGGWVQLEMSLEAPRIKTKEQLGIRCLESRRGGRRIAHAGAEAVCMTRWGAAASP